MDLRSFKATLHPALLTPDASKRSSRACSFLVAFKKKTSIRISKPIPAPAKVCSASANDQFLFTVRRSSLFALFLSAPLLLTHCTKFFGRELHCVNLYCIRPLFLSPCLQVSRIIRSSVLVLDRFEKQMFFGSTLPASKVLARQEEGTRRNEMMRNGGRISLLIMLLILVVVLGGITWGKTNIM